MGHASLSVSRRVLLGAAGLSALRLGAPALAAGAADSVSVRLDWLPWGVQAPFHLAAAKGWFARHGLDVKLEDGNGSVTAVQLIGNGQYDVGHAALCVMAMARSHGAPVRAIANFARTEDIGLMFPKSAPLDLKTLKGKKFGYTASSLEAPFIDKFLASAGLTRNDIELVGIDGGAKAGVLVSGRMDGVFSSIPSLLPQVSVIKPLDAIRFADYGLQFPSFGLLANERTLAARPDVLKRFASVVAGTWTYIYAGHQEEGVQAMLAARPQAKLPAAVVRGQIDALRGFFDTPATAGEPIGVMAEADWTAGLKTLAENKLLDRPVSPAECFTNELLDRSLIAELGRGAA